MFMRNSAFVLVLLNLSTSSSIASSEFISLRTFLSIQMRFSSSSYNNRSSFLVFDRLMSIAG